MVEELREGQRAELVEAARVARARVVFAEGGVEIEVDEPARLRVREGLAPAHLR